MFNGNYLRALLKFVVIAMIIQAQAVSANPMKPPPFALYKFQQQRYLQAGIDPDSLKKAEQPLVLNSIIYSSQRKIAVVNNQLYAIGERVNGAKIIDIKRDSVKLNKKGKITVLSVYDQNVASQAQQEQERL